MPQPSDNPALEPLVTSYFDPVTHTLSYLVQDPSSSACAIIDSVLDFDYPAGQVSYQQADRLIEHIQSQNLKLEWIIETHVHADHLSAAPYIQAKLGGKIGISEAILTIEHTVGALFGQAPSSGSAFDVLFADNQTYRIGNLTATCLATPGHTPACMSHLIGNAAFVGDTLFLPDVGSARADFPGGDAGALYDSIQRLLALPEKTRLFVGHDYPPAGREPQGETSIAAQKTFNIHVGGQATRAHFIARRTARDAELAVPNLLIPALQVNIRAGTLPTNAQGEPMLQVPINTFKSSATTDKREPDC